jgi:hypothetical protein
MSSKQIEFLVKLRDALSMAAEATNEYIDSLAPAVMKEKNLVSVVSETTFSILKFESQEGTKLGSYEVAYKANNIADKWIQALNILRSSNATIQNRYYGQSYQFSYWIYGEDKIYRQKLKGGTKP